MAYKNNTDERLRASRRRHYTKNKKQYYERNKKRKAEIKKFIQNHKSIGCCMCDECEPCALDLHHKDPRQKTINPSRMITNGWGIERIRAEIDKCVVLCANCHRKVTFGIIELNVGSIPTGCAKDS